MVRASLGIVTALTASVASYLVVRVLTAERAAQRPPAIRTEPGRTPAILVLGSTALPTGPSLELASRLDLAWRLWRSGVASFIAVSGGVDGDVDEVDVMRDYLVDLGVPSDRIIEARPGANTRQSLAAAARISAERGLGPWIAVSTPFHARRLLDEAARSGVTIVVAGPGDSPEMRNPRLRRVRLATEVIGTVAYALPEPAMTALSRALGRRRHSLPRRIAGVPG